MASFAYWLLPDHCLTAGSRPAQSSEVYYGGLANVPSMNFVCPGNGTAIKEAV